MKPTFALLAAGALIVGSSGALFGRPSGLQPQPTGVRPDTSAAQPSTAVLPWMSHAVAHQWNVEHIKQAQTGLRNAKLYGGRITGVYDAETRTAVREFQRLHDLPVTGALSDSLLTMLLAVKPAPCAQTR
jgi:hypothetical protein